jgi:hypothetical protein
MDDLQSLLILTPEETEQIDVEKVLLKPGTDVERTRSIEVWLIHTNPFFLEGQLAPKKVPSGNKDW